MVPYHVEDYLKYLILDTMDILNEDHGPLQYPDWRIRPEDPDFKPRECHTQDLYMREADGEVRVFSGGSLM